MYDCALFVRVMSVPHTPLRYPDFLLSEHEMMRLSGSQASHHDLLLDKHFHE